MLTLRTRVVLAVAVATVPALGAILYTGIESRRTHVEAGRARLLRDVRGIVASQSMQLAEVRHELSVLSRLPEVRDGSPEACTRLLLEVRRENPRLGQLTRMTPDQRMDCSTVPFGPDQADVSDIPSVRAVLRERRDVVGFYRLSRDSVTPLVTVMHPVYDAKRELQFVLASAMPLPWFAERARLAADSGYAVSLVERSGRAIILHSGRKTFRNQQLNRPPAQFDPVDSTSSTFLGKGGDGNPRVAAFALLPSTDGPEIIATIAAPAAPLLATAAASLRNQLGLLAACAIIGGLLAWLASSGWLMDDVRAVEAAANRVNRDELSLDLTHRPRTRELAAVVDAFERALTRIEREQRSYVQLANASGDRVCRVDPHLRVKDANDALLDVTGLTRSTLANRTIVEVYGVTAVAREIAALAATCIAGDRPIERELAGPKGSDGQQWTEVRCVPSHRDDGTVDGALIITRDATARRALQREVEKSQRVESLGRFAGGIAHDFNNMLTVVMNCAQLGSRELPDAHPAREDMRQIEDVARRSADLTKQLLAFAKRQPSEAQALEPTVLLRDCEALLHRLLGSDIVLFSDVAPGTSRIWFERSQFDQVLVNLAANARDAMPARGRLTITFQDAVIDASHQLPLPSLTPGRYVQMDVCDSGSGMDPEVAARVFEPFFTTKGESQGTGLGLAVVYGAVTQHGGAVWVDSSPGMGSTFHVLFRQPPSVLEPVRAASDDGSYMPEPGMRVLVVDDEPAIRSVASRLLTARGFVTTTASGGAEGLAQVEAASPPFGAVVTDLTMPHMTGAELAQELIARQPYLGVVITSGYPEALGRLDGTLMDRCVLLPKPFNEASLTAAVLASSQVPLRRR